MAQMFAKAAGGNWSAAGTWSATSSMGTDSVGPPTAATDVVFELTSGNVTIDATAACRSIDCNFSMAYAGTLTHNSSVTLSIGDATAGTGNRALRFSSGMTYTLGSVTTSVINFVSTSATQQTITTAGKVFGTPTWNASSNGSWLLSDAFSCGTTRLTVAKGTWNSNGQTVTCSIFDSSNTNTRTITLGSSTVNCSLQWFVQTTTNLTFNANTSTITQAASNGFFGGGLTYNIVSITAANPTIDGANTLATLSYIGTAAKTCSLSLAANQVVTGTFTITPNSVVNAVLVSSNSLGTAFSITAATLVCSHRVDFRDITGAGAATWTTGASGATYFGDCGGNSGITFTNAATQTWNGTSGGNWSTNAWTSRVPLPQDDVNISSAFSASQTVTLDMPRAGKSINWTGATGTPAWAKTTATSVYGSVTMITGMTNSGTVAFTMEGRGAFTFTSSGQTFTNQLTVSAVGGKVTFQDAFTDTTTNSVIINNGEVDFASFTHTCVNVLSNGAATKTLTLGTATVICTNTGGTLWNFGANTNLTVTATTGTVRFSDTGASSKTFASGGKAFGVFDVTTGGAGAIIITGAASLIRITATGGGTKTFTLPGSTTTTLTGTTPFPSGAASNLLTFAPSSGSATVSFSNQASCDYVSLTNIIASGTTPAYAGTHSTDGGGNTNWVFSDPSTSNTKTNVIHSQAVARAAIF